MESSPKLATKACTPTRKGSEIADSARALTPPNTTNYSCGPPIKANMTNDNNVNTQCSATAIQKRRPRNSVKSAKVDW